MATQTKTHNPSKLKDLEIPVAPVKEKPKSSVLPIALLAASAMLLSAAAAESTAQPINPSTGLTDKEQDKLDERISELTPEEQDLAYAEIDMLMEEFAEEGAVPDFDAYLDVLANLAPDESDYPRPTTTVDYNPITDIYTVVVEGSNPSERVVVEYDYLFHDEDELFDYMFSMFNKHAWLEPWSGDVALSVACAMADMKEHWGPLHQSKVETLKHIMNLTDGEYGFFVFEFPMVSHDQQ